MLVKTTKQDIDAFRVHVAVEKNFLLERLNPFLPEAEEQFLTRALSEEMYKELDTKLTAGNIDAGSLLEQLLLRARAAAGNYAMYLYYPHSEVQIGTGGSTRKEGDNEKTPYQYQGLAARESYLTMAHQALEGMVQFLEKNEAETAFTKWKTSEAYTKRTKAFVGTASILNKFVNIGHSRLLFTKLKTHLDEVELLELKGLLNEQYDSLLSDLEAEANKDLVFACRGYVAHAAFEKALAALPITIGNEGVYQLVVSGNNTANIKGKEAPDSGFVSARARYHEGQMRKYFGKIKELTQDVNSTPIELNEEGDGMVMF